MWSYSVSGLSMLSLDPGVSALESAVVSSCGAGECTRFVFFLGGIATWILESGTKRGLLG